MDQQVKGGRGSSNRGGGGSRPVANSWMGQFHKVGPILDDNGNPLTTQPLNAAGFWPKPDHDRFNKPKYAKDSKRR